MTDEEWNQYFEVNVMSAVRTSRHFLPKMLAKNSGKVLTREQILERIWDLSGNYVEDNTLTVYIKRLRKKLDTNMIKTVKGLGYRLEV